MSTLASSELTQTPARNTMEMSNQVDARMGRSPGSSMGVESVFRSFRSDIGDLRFTIDFDEDANTQLQNGTLVRIGRGPTAATCRLLDLGLQISIAQCTSLIGHVVVYSLFQYLFASCIRCFA